MGSDRARVSFEPSRQWRAVIAQQGRVSLEADINEQVAIDASRDQLTTLELVGPCASPDGGYQVSTASAGDLSVSAGTLYLGGQRLRLEQAIAYSHQPEWLNAATDPLYTPPAVPGGGRLRAGLPARRRAGGLGRRGPDARRRGARRPRHGPAAEDRAARGA